MQLLKVTDKGALAVTDEEYDIASDLAIDFLASAGHESDEPELSPTQTALMAGVVLAMRADRGRGKAMPAPTGKPVDRPTPAEVTFIVNLFGFMRPVDPK